MCCKNGCACFPVPENGENDADPRALQCEKQVTGLEPVTARNGRRLGTADCRTRENDKYSQNVLMKGFKNMKHAVVMQTDFGTDNLSVSTMKGVCRQICPELDLFDSTHAIRTFDVLAASDALVYTIPFWPEETVFVSVVDPGVGTARKSCVAKLKNGSYIVTPDNGTLTYVKEQIGIVAVREIDETVNRYPTTRDVHIFHGRDVYAYCAGRLAAGVIDFEGVGPE